MVITRNILIMIIKFASYDLLLASNNTFMTDSQYLGTIQIWRNLNEHDYYLTSTKSVICQIDANCFPFQSLNMLPFHIRLERLTLIYHDLISIIFLNIILKLAHFPSFSCLSNYFDNLLWKIVKPRDNNEIKPQLKKYSANRNQSDIIS